MAIRQTIQQWGMRARPFAGAVVVLVLIGAVIYFLPSRGAAAILGIFTGFVLTRFVISKMSFTTQMAILWTSITITADAAYAKLNDQTPITLANALTKVVDAIFKLADPLIKGFGLSGADARVKMNSVAPEFVWAVILSLIALYVIGFALQSRERRS